MSAILLWHVSRSVAECCAACHVRVPTVTGPARPRLQCACCMYTQCAFRVDVKSGPVHAGYALLDVGASRGVPAARSHPAPLRHAALAALPPRQRSQHHCIHLFCAWAHSWACLDCGSLGRCMGRNGGRAPATGLRDCACMEGFPFWIPLGPGSLCSLLHSHGNGAGMPHATLRVHLGRTTSANGSASPSPHAAAWLQGQLGGRVWVTHWVSTTEDHNNGGRPRSDVPGACPGGRCKPKNGQKPVHKLQGNIYTL